MDYTYHYTSPIGGITMASNGESLTGLWFDGQKYFASTLSQRHMEKQLPVFDRTCEWLDLYTSAGRALISYRLFSCMSAISDGMSTRF